MPVWILPLSLALAMAVVLGWPSLQRRHIRRRQVLITRLAAWPVSPPLGDGHTTSGTGTPDPVPDVDSRRHVTIGGTARHRLVSR